MHEPFVSVARFRLWLAGWLFATLFRWSGSWAWGGVDGQKLSEGVRVGCGIRCSKLACPIEKTGGGDGQDLSERY